MSNACWIQSDRIPINFYLKQFNLNKFLSLVFSRVCDKQFVISFILSKVDNDEGGMKWLYHGLSALAGHNPRAKSRGLSPRSGITIS